MSKKSQSNKADPILSPEDASKVLKADVARILNKVKQKKPLTAQERKLLESMAEKEAAPAAEPDAPKWAKSIAALCGILGIDRKTYYNHQKRFPNDIPKTRTNGEHNVGEWREYLRTKGVIADPAEDEEDIEHWKLRDVKAKALDREHKNRVTRGDYLHRDDIREEITLLVGEAIKLLRDKFENELPPVTAGLDAPRIRKENGRAIDEVCSLLHNNEIATESE